MNYWTQFVNRDVIEVGRRKLQKVTLWAKEAAVTSTGTSPAVEDLWVVPSALPSGKFLLSVSWTGENDPPTLNFFDHLNLIGLSSLSNVRRVRSSIHLPPEAYFNTGRGPKPYPTYYQGLCSGSAVFELNNGEHRALSAVFALDKSHHGNTPEHVNVRVVGWPVNQFNPDNTIDIGERIHTLPANTELAIKVAAGSTIEQVAVLLPKKSQTESTESSK